MKPAELNQRSRLPAETTCSDLLPSHIQKTNGCRDQGLPEEGPILNTMETTRLRQLIELLAEWDEMEIRDHDRNPR